MKKSTDTVDSGFEPLDILNQIPTPVMVVDKDLQVRYMNLAGQDFVNIPADEAKGRPCSEVFHSEDCGTDQCRMIQAMGTGKRLTGRNVASIGDRKIHIQNTAAPLTDAEGNLIGGVEFVLDITDHIHAEELNADYAGQIAAIDKSMAVSAFNMDGTIIAANKNFLNLMGYTSEEVIGKHHSMFVHPSQRDSAEYKEFWAALNRGEFQTAEFKRIAKGGREVWIQASYSPIVDLDGKPYKVVKYAADVTERVRDQYRLREQSRTIMEISTPAIKLWEGVIILPVVGVIDSARAQQMMESILTKISETNAKVIILDIQGVAAVDTAVANHLIKITRATKLMGCECIVSGISPEVAQTIVQLGIALDGINTTSTLMDALKDAFRALGISVGNGGRS